MTQRLTEKGRVNPVKYCRDCEEATVHSTGSQLWVSCRLQDGWRSINAECNLPKGNKPMKLTVYSSKNCPRCKALKKWLRRNKLSFIEKSLDDTDVMTELVMRNLFVLSTPALETENTVYLSDQIFDADNRLNPELKELLRSKPVKKKIVECSNCRKEVEVPDDIDPEQVAVFCSKKCSYAEAGW